MGQIIDNLLAYRVLTMLVRPFSDTKAFALGIVDKDGNNLIKSTDFTTSEQKDAYNYLTRLVFNIKKTINKLPGGSTKTQNLIAALFLIKENSTSEHLLKNAIIMIEQGNSFMEEQMIVENFLVEEGIANVTGSAVVTDQPFIKKRVKTFKRWLKNKDEGVK